MNPLLKTSFSWLFIALSGLAISSCASLMGGMGNTDGGDVTYPGDEYMHSDGAINFTILQMNDVYEIAPLEKGKVGGMARVATVRNQLLAENYNVLTVLAGDFLSPSLIGTLKHEGKRIRGRQMVDVMNNMGVNLVAFGNHEFDIKEEELQERLNESYFEWLGTNVLHQKSNKIEPFHKDSYGYKYFVPETYVWEVNDYQGNVARIGFYSACVNDNQQPFVYYEDPYQEATKAYLELTNKADVIIGLTHLELPMDMKLAAMLPKTALIMGGHEHENRLDSVGSVVIAKADANAKTVYVHRFTYYPATKTYELTSELMPINDEIASEATVDSVVQHWQQIQHDQISQLVANPEEVIYNAKTPLDGLEKSVRNQQTNLGNFIATSMAKAAKKPVECAFFNGGSIRIDDKLEGDITAVDVFRAMPFGGGVFEIELKGNILKRALDAGMENKGHGGYLQWYNIEFNTASKTWEIAGKTLDVGKTYRVAVNQYVAEGKEERLEFFNSQNFSRIETAKDSDNNDLRSDIRKAVVSYLKQLK